jgi:hypothetical protein
MNELILDDADRTKINQLMIEQQKNNDFSQKSKVDLE